MKFIVVDDEPLARKAVMMLAADHDCLECCGQFNSAAAAEAFLETNEVDLVFLDINMPRVTGLEFARTLPASTMVIFTTAYSEYAAESYELDAVDYLIKPIEPERFALAVRKAAQRRELLAQQPEGSLEGGGDGAPESLFVKADRKYTRVNLSEILFVEGLKDYVVIYLRDRKIMTHMNLAAAERLLPESKFMRVSKSYIVNLDHIDSFDNNDIYIADYVVPIGTAYRQPLHQRLL